MGLLDPRFNTDDNRKVIARIEARIKQEAEDVKASQKLGRQVHYLAESLDTAPSSDGLDFSDITTTAGAFGAKQYSPKVTLAEKGTIGHNTAADAQLKAARLNSGRKTFDGEGGAKSDGTLTFHTLNAGPPMDLSRFSERAKKDPEIIASFNSLAGLQSKRTELEAQRTQLTKELGLATTGASMKILTDQLDEKNRVYGANLVAIVNKTDQIEKRREEIRKNYPDIPDL